MKSTALYIGAFAAAAVLCSATACSESDCLPNRGHGTELDGKVRVALRVPNAATRTAVGGDDGSSVDIAWSDGDCIALWAAPVGSPDELTLGGDVLTHTTNANDLSGSIFTGAIEPMADGDYNYTAVYPEPVLKDFGYVYYDIPSVQSGAYDPALDIMMARATAPALKNYRLNDMNPEVTNDLDLRFGHLTHALKITIPSGRNLFGRPVERLKIEFRQEVVGRMGFQIADADGGVTLDNGADAITLEFDTPVDEGDSFWVYMAPATIEGAVRFTAYAGLEMSRTLATTAFDGRSLAAGHITPISLTVDEKLPVTWFDCTVDTSHLGESVETLTLTMPEGFTFAGNKQSVVLRPDEEGRFSFGVVTDDLAGMAGLAMTTVYESAHAVVEDTRSPITIPAEYTPDEHNDMSVTAPYLFFEDFSGLAPSFEYHTTHTTSDATSHDPISLAGYGLDGWTGTRVGGAEGVSLRIQSRVEIGLGVVNRIPGRAESAPVANLKEGATVRVRVEYDYAGDRYNATGGKSGNPLVTFGYTTNQGTFAAGDNIDNVVVSDMQIPIDGNDNNTPYYGNTPHVHTVYITTCDALTRLCWKLSNNRPSAFAANGVYWMYIDNIRITIDELN